MKSQPDEVVAVQAGAIFAGGESWLIGPGLRLSSTHPAVKERPEWFTPSTDDGRFVTCVQGHIGEAGLVLAGSVRPRTDPAVQKNPAAFAGGVLDQRHVAGVAEAVRYNSAQAREERARDVREAGERGELASQRKQQRADAIRDEAARLQKQAEKVSGATA